MILNLRLSPLLAEYPQVDINLDDISIREYPDHEVHCDLKENLELLLESIDRLQYEPPPR